ncbi:MAG: hypothetical protein K6G18_08105 [Treponema sp.]|nr:hypothetical protein [Treponema sp.]
MNENARDAASGMQDGDKSTGSLIRLTKLLAEYFYAVTLYDDRKNKDLIPDGLLEQYVTDDGSFAIDRLIEDTRNGKFREEYYRYLLPADLLTADSGTLKEIGKVHADNQKSSLKGGYIRAVLEVLYDSKFQAEFNRKTNGFLEKASGRQDFILLFLKLASTQDNRGKRRWDYSGATEIKEIGKKEKGKTMEMVNNPYTAYKLFGQGEYSKLLIGLRAMQWPAMDGLQKKYAGTKLEEDDVYTFQFTDLRKKGMEAILADEAVCMYTTKAGKEILIIPDGRPGSTIPYNSEVVCRQIQEITTVLQHFNNYIPYELDGDLKAKLHKECTSIYFKKCKGEFIVFDKNEADFVNRYYKAVVNGLTDVNRKAFDEASGRLFITKNGSIMQKIQSLSMLMYSKHALQKYPDAKVQLQIQKLAENERWQGILGKYKNEFGDFFYAAGDENGRITIDDIDADDDAFTADESLNPELQFIQQEEESADEKYLKYLFRLHFPKKRTFLDYIDGYFAGIERGDVLYVNGKSKKASKKKELISSLRGALIVRQPDVKAGGAKNSTGPRRYAENLQARINEIANKNTVRWDTIEHEFFSKKGDYEKFKRAKLYFAMYCLGMGVKESNRWDTLWKFYSKREFAGCTDETAKELAKNSFYREMNDIVRTFRRERRY